MVDMCVWDRKGGEWEKYSSGENLKYRKWHFHYLFEAMSTSLLWLIFLISTFLYFWFLYLLFPILHFIFFLFYFIFFLFFFLRQGIAFAAKILSKSTSEYQKRDKDYQNTEELAAQCARALRNLSVNRTFLPCTYLKLLFLELFSLKLFSTFFFSAE